MRVERAEDISGGYVLAAALALILFGLTLRFVALDAQGLWHDEVYSIAHLSGFDAYVMPGSDLKASEPPRRVDQWLEELETDRYWETLERNLVHEGHPPLYQLGLKGWTSLFGHSVVAVRWFSLLPALLTIALAYLLGVRLGGPRVGAVAAALVAVSPFHLYYSIEARNYAWSLLFSALALLGVLGLWNGREATSRRPLFLWWIGAVGACYTHYYAGLYCAVLLILLLAFRRRSLGSALKLGFPFLLFLPWVPVLQAQIEVHSQHWTAGSPGLSSAAAGFINVLLDQLTGPFNSATSVEQIVGAVALLGGGLLLVRDGIGDEIQFDARWIFLSVPTFGIAVLAVDLITDHHTVLVTRYLISVLPCLALICAWLITGRHRAYTLILVLLVAANVYGSVATSSGERAPKQMLREAGTYISNLYAPDDLILVTPSGPTLLGLARYLPKDALLAAAPPNQAIHVAERFASDERTVWLARQNLGVEYELSKDTIPGRVGKRVRFAGIDVIPLRTRQSP